MKWLNKTIEITKAIDNEIKGEDKIANHANR
jgi:hypothetical protein